MPGPLSQSLPLASVDAELVVPLVDGRSVRAAHLDIAASAPCLVSVAEAVTEALPWYASVHRGAGYASTVSGSLLERSRLRIARFVGARPDDQVILTRNTTDALTLLSRSLPAGTEVITFDSEHHANLLPWRDSVTRHLPTPERSSDVAGALDAALAEAGPGPRLVAVTGISNVTGERWPLAEIVEVARAHGARVVVDAAQLAAHAPIDLARLGADWVALSGHKLGAPFGSGALIGRADWLREAPPYLPGGGAVKAVTVASADWAELPFRHEGGTPNLIGAAALAAACDALAAVGAPALAAYEDQLTARLHQGLDALPGVRRLRTWEDAPASGVISFVVKGLPAGLVAAALSAEHGVAVRAGRFCAHPLVDRLLGPDADPSGAIRVSVGATTSAEDVERFLLALRQVIVEGPIWRYVAEEGWRAAGDPRVCPELTGLEATPVASPCEPVRSS
jgi:selenocysteine lyase/cysteine desulfurase